MSDIEGAICDVCGNAVGPHGCCSTRLGLLDTNEKLCSRISELQAELTRLREALKNIRDRKPSDGVGFATLCGRYELIAQEALEGKGHE